MQETSASLLERFGSSRTPRRGSGWWLFIHLCCAAGCDGRLYH